MAKNTNVDSEEQVSTKSSWWNSWWTDFNDAQRIERLKQCRELDSILQKCQEARIKKKPHVSSMDENVCAIRMMKYFGWRQELATAVPEESDDKLVRSPSKQLRGVVETAKDEVKRVDSPKYQPHVVLDEPCTSCAKETHATWACRAIALGCAADLVQLKECFQQYDQSQVLAISETSYDQQNTSFVPCGDIQRALSLCVNKSAARLEARQRNRSGKNK